MRKPDFICVMVTEIAGLLNKNPYQNADEARENFVNRVRHNQRKPDVDIPKKYHKMIEKNIHETEITKVQEKIQAIQTYKCTDEVKEEIKRKIYTQRGILLEDLAIQDYQTTLTTPIQLHKDFIKRFYLIDNIGFYIGGRIDGLLTENNENIVIEVKNRQNQIFEEIPLYEQIQLECYARMLHCKKCIFIQRYDHVNQVCEYLPNDDLWKEIKEEVVKIVKSLTPT